ncbi:MAG: metalloregulator ArsR/SmtB family transcription factor [Methanothrix sp.]|uniref:ArsR/SmtB family transcription factor n=1 Tax=Methanothrix sp. TaxID=90426 RepID=UPI0025EE6D9F|nr:metalloregulator ArsR/SmtB family transcription factor [Methanothrix sp.]MCK9407228.1 metalloregulator ArsR/SmtB family transcription factor [Methanothrix sp.]
MPRSMNDEICEESIDEVALCSLARLIGDTDKARTRTRKLSSLMKTIDMEGPEGEVEVFKAAADPCRLRILKLLKEGELCVCEIMTALSKPQSSTSHHLSILREAGLVKERRDGKWSYYRLADGAVNEMIKQAEVLKKKQ